MFTIKPFHDDLTLIRLSTAVSRALSFATWVPLADGLLVDSGFPHAARDLLRALDGRRVDGIVNTHAHEDHFGGNGPVQRARGVPVQAPAASLALLRKPRLEQRQPYRKLVWGTPRPCAATPLPDVVTTPRLRLEVVPTPGHSADHVAFFEPSRRWLFAGDLYLSVKVRGARPCENGADLIASLERVVALRPRTLFCTHKGVVVNAEDALRAKLAFLVELRDTVRRLRDAGHDTATIAARAIGPDPVGFRLLTRGDFSALHLVNALLAEPTL